MQGFNKNIDKKRNQKNNFYQLHFFRDLFLDGIK